MKKMVIVDGVQYELVNINSTNGSNTQASTTTTNQCNTNHTENNSGLIIICVLGLIFLLLYAVWKMCEYDSVNLP